MDHSGKRNSVDTQMSPSAGKANVTMRESFPSHQVMEDHNARSNRFLMESEEANLEIISSAPSNTLDFHVHYLRQGSPLKLSAAKKSLRSSVVHACYDSQLGEDQGSSPHSRGLDSSQDLSSLSSARKAGRRL